MRLKASAKSPASPVEEEPVTLAVAEPPVSPDVPEPEPDVQVEPAREKRTKLDRLLAQIERLEVEKLATRAKINDLTIAERDARQDALRETPDKRSDVGGALSAVSKIARDRKDAEAKLAGFDAELAACSAVRAELVDESEVNVRAAIVREAKARNRVEGEHITVLSEWLEDGLEVWAGFVGFLNTRSECAELAGVRDAEHLERLQGLFRPSLQPCPRDFLAMVEMVYEVCCDPHQRGLREGTPWTKGKHHVVGLVEHTLDLRDRLVYAPQSSMSYASSLSPAAADARPVQVEWRDSRSVPGGNIRLGVGSVPN